MTENNDKNDIIIAITKDSEIYDAGNKELMVIMVITMKIITLKIDLTTSTIKIYHH